MKRLRMAVAIFGLTGLGSVHAQTIAYEDPSNQGNQAWGGNLGLLFQVNSPIIVTALGVFNASGSGTITGTINVVIYNTTTNTAVTPVVTFHGHYTPAGLGFDVFQPITPVPLGVGSYEVDAVGFSSTDLNGNRSYSGTGPVLNNGGGLLTFTAASFDASAVLDDPLTCTTFPCLPAPAGLSQFDAGTFEFSAAPSPPQTTGNDFVPVTPCRVVDTRNPNGAFGGPSMGGGTSRSFPIPTGACSIPASATAYSLNITVVPHGPLGFLTIWPSGQSQPLASTLNSDGRIKANAAIVPAGSNGAVSVYVTNTTDVILDIDGYFVPGSTARALSFYPHTPCRIADTRGPAGVLGGPSLATGGVRTFPILSSACEVSPAAQAYSLNLTAVPLSTLGYLTAWPYGESQPLVSSLNDLTGTIVANAAVVPTGTGGAVNVFSTDQTNLVIDTNGYFATPGSGGLALYTMQPCRVLDTRQSPGTPISSLNVSVLFGPCVVPSNAQAYVLNATVIPTGPLGFLTIWPQGEVQPLVSTLNAVDGAITSNLAIVPTTNGSISIFASQPTHLILDISGYFAP